MSEELKNISDAREREQALDATASFIVQAPAGSGKTELLMQRYLALLSTVERPEQILAITFTKKAAGEMQNRIVNALRMTMEPSQQTEPNNVKTAELAQKALERDSRLTWNILENPVRLKIQTIDSFCASLTRQMPLISRIGRELAISDNPEELYTEAAERTVAKVEQDNDDGVSVRSALRHLDNSVHALITRLVIMLEKRDQWLRHINREMHEDDLKRLLQGSFNRLVQDTLNNVREAFPQKYVEAFLGCARYAASNLFQEESNSEITNLRTMTSLPSASADNLPLWRGVRELLLTSDNGLRKPTGINKSVGFPSDKNEEAVKGKKEFQELLSALEREKGLLRALSKIAILPLPRFDEEEWEILKSLVHLLPVAEQELMKVFEERGVLDFQAVAMAALHSLGTDENPTDLMLSLDLKIQHILIDEYQDTSRIQLGLLKALTRGWQPDDGRTLFIVGDPMQSIYLFREAEVGLFLDAKTHGIGNVKLIPLTLKTNFRSQENIVQWVNESFKHAFPENEDSFFGSVPYAPFAAVKPRFNGKGVECLLFEEVDDAVEAEKVASTVKGIDTSESIAILCRSRTHLAEVVKTLKKAGMDFRAQEMDPLLSRPVIQDLLALVRALMHPYDRIAWLALLRAPWAGLSLSDLHKLCVNDKESPVWTLIHDEKRVQTLSQDGQKRIAKIIEKLNNALILRGRVPFQSLIEGLWIDLGGPACVENEAGMKDAEAFFKMMEKVSVAGNIDSRKTLESRIDRLYAMHSGKEDTNIDLMTIHKAKGLEFDHVILPGLGKRPRGENKKLLLWMERKKEDLLLAPIEKKGGNAQSPIYNFLQEIQKEKDELERTRLFYVAATRPRKRLYLFGHIKGREENGIKVDSKSFLSCIQQVLREDMIVQKKAGIPETIPETETKTLQLKRLSSSWKRPEPKEPIKIEIQEFKEVEKIEPIFNWAGERAKHLGTVVHEYLCSMAKEGLVSWDADRIKSEATRMKTKLCQWGLSKEAAEKNAQKGVDILCAALHDRKGRWILEKHREGAVELPITGIVQEEIIHVKIDRTFIDDKGIRWIIDYKTGMHEGGNLEEFLNSERERYRPQLERYAAILAAGGEKREIKKGLYYPALKKPAFIEV